MKNDGRLEGESRYKMRKDRMKYRMKSCLVALLCVSLVFLSELVIFTVTLARSRNLQDFSI
ncbi:MAG: hypothetical protein EAZ92_05535 [Candidatus Kapaibacterium sp.]|nr:MAG: hypothetical protein EAZ92_05535 [Candidatus Kapabacteria bacterium]